MAISTTIAAAIAAGAALAGGAGGYIWQKKQGVRAGNAQESRLKQKIADLKEEARKEVSELREKAEKEASEKRDNLNELEKRLVEKDVRLEKKESEVETKLEELKQEQTRREKESKRLEAALEQEEEKLSEISGLTKDQAVERAMEVAERTAQEEILRKARKLEQEGEKQLQDKARQILTSTIQRYGASQVTEHMSSYVTVEDESMIGRIIGKEGRNIQHLEKVTGCEIVVDESPNTIMVSCFSPLRRQVAKTAIERLIKDGRIHPGRIEGIVDEAKKQINEDIRKSGEEALYELGIIDFPEKLVHLVGRLKYRTSYSQNMLAHSVEVAHIARMLAEELGADVEIALKAALLHDIGKALDHDVEGNHVELGDKIMKKFGLDERIIAAANPHDEGYQEQSVEQIIVQVADAVSAARPGARRESLEQYVKRMEDLENIATSHEGVDKCYAIHAGREVRVFVHPEQVDDLSARKIASAIAKQIESELQYPGDVKVNVIRETRSEALAR